MSARHSPLTGGLCYARDPRFALRGQDQEPEQRPLGASSPPPIPPVGGCRACQHGDGSPWAPHPQLPAYWGPVCVKARACGALGRAVRASQALTHPTPGPVGPERRRRSLCSSGDVSLLARAALLGRWVSPGAAVHGPQAGGQARLSTAPPGRWTAGGYPPASQGGR